MANCGGTFFETIDLLGVNDADQLKIARAKILTIDHQARTAGIQYLTFCEGLTKTQGVEFFYHCEFSHGSVEDLQDGHWAFAVDDEVYVISLPDTGAVTGRIYIVGHADIRDTKTCGTEWTMLRVYPYWDLIQAGGAGTIGRVAFVIIDLVTGKLYDGWPEITWPIFAHAAPNNPLNDGEYGIQNYRNFLFRCLSFRVIHGIPLIDVLAEDSFDYTEWDDDLERYVILSHINDWGTGTSSEDFWGLDNYDQFRQGFSWRPGSTVYNGSDYHTVYDYPSPTTGGGGDVHNDIVDGQSYCQYTWDSEPYWWEEHGSGITDNVFYYGRVDVYVHVPPAPWQDIHPTLELPQFPGEMKWERESEDLKNGYYKQVYDTHIWPSNRVSFGPYDRTLRREQEEDRPYTAMPIFASMTNGFDTSWFAYQDDTVGYHFSFPVHKSFSRVTEWTSQHNERLWLCDADDSDFDVVDIEEKSYWFRVSAPWRANFYEATIRGKRTMEYVYADAGSSGTLLMEGHPTLCSHYGSLGSEEYPEVLLPLWACSTSLMLGQYGIWGMTVVAHLSDSMGENPSFRYESEFGVTSQGPLGPLANGVSPINLDGLTIDLNQLVIKATMGFSRRSKYADPADVKIADLIELPVPAGVIDAIHHMMVDNQSFVELLPPPLGTCVPEQSSAETLSISLGGGGFQIDMFAVILQPPDDLTE